MVSKAAKLADGFDVDHPDFVNHRHAQSLVPLWVWNIAPSWKFGHKALELDKLKRQGTGVGFVCEDQIKHGR